MKVIAFSGRARVGKSHITNTVARILWDQGGYIPVVLPLAQPLKDAAAAAGFTKEDDPQGYRNYCQTHGAAAREGDPDHWLRLWHDMYLDAMMRELGHGQEFVVIVDDVRYPNELELINGMHNARTIFVDEGSRSGTLEDENAEWRNHHSEYLANEAHSDWAAYKDQFDYRFMNDNEAFEDLNRYLRAGDDKVISAWIGTHDCDCILCEAHITNSDISEEELVESLDAVFKREDVDMEDDVDEKSFIQSLFDAIDDALEAGDIVELDPDEEEDDDDDDSESTD